MVAFAIANRAPVSVSFDPFDPDRPGLCGDPAALPPGLCHPDPGRRDRRRRRLVQPGQMAPPPRAGWKRNWRGCGPSSIAPSAMRHCARCACHRAQGSVAGKIAGKLSQDAAPRDCIPSRNDVAAPPRSSAIEEWRFDGSPGKLARKASFRHVLRHQDLRPADARSARCRARMPAPTWSASYSFRRRRAMSMPATARALGRPGAGPRPQGGAVGRC